MQKEKEHKKCHDLGVGLSLAGWPVGRLEVTRPIENQPRMTREEGSTRGIIEGVEYFDWSRISPVFCGRRSALLLVVDVFGLWSTFVVYRSAIGSFAFLLSLSAICGSSSVFRSERFCFVVFHYASTGSSQQPILVSFHKRPSQCGSLSSGQQRRLFVRVGQLLRPQLAPATVCHQVRCDYLTLTFQPSLCSFVS